MIVRRAHGGEAGFAMLVVFLLAACIGIGLYMELPRVVMESQRDREELLIDRGTQYQRAIQVFYRKFSRYPTDLDALDNTNNIHFLRRRYKDPMTGEDEWRIIHAAGPGIFTDSLVNAPPGGQPAQTADTSTGSEEETPTPIWMQRRPSDMILAGGDSSMEPPMPGMEETPPQPSASNSGVPAAGTVVTAGVAQTGLDPGSQTAVALTLPSPVPTGPPPPGTIATQQGGNQPPMPIVPGLIAIAPGQAGAYPTTVTAVGGSQTAPTSNPAMQMINQLLSSPNPRGMATAIQSSAGQQPLQAGGIGGVASKLEAESIKVYNDRSKYNEWEFIYDPRQDRTASQASMMNQQNRGPNLPGTSGPLPGQPGTNNPGRGGPQGPGGPNFGGQPGFGFGGTPQPQPGLRQGR
jgi:type II secretory pathway pseudopilin PulG